VVVDRKGQQGNNGSRWRFVNLEKIELSKEEVSSSTFFDRRHWLFFCLLPFFCDLKISDMFVYVVLMMLLIQHFIQVHDVYLHGYVSLTSFEQFFIDISL